MTRIIHGIRGGITHGAGDGLSEFPSDLADVGTAGSAVAFSVQASATPALVTLASCIRGSDALALPMRVLVAGPAVAVADSMIKPAAFRSDCNGSLGNRPHLFGPRWVSSARRRPVQTQTTRERGRDGRAAAALMLVAGAATSGCLGASEGVPAAEAERPLSLQQGDPRGDARQRARCAESGHLYSQAAD